MFRRSKLRLIKSNGESVIIEHRTAKKKKNCNGVLLKNPDLVWLNSSFVFSNKK